MLGRVEEFTTKHNIQINDNAFTEMQKLELGEDVHDKAADIMNELSDEQDT